MRRHVAVLLAAFLVMALAPAASAAPEKVTVLLTFEQDRAPAATAARLARVHGGSVVHIYENVLNGAAIQVPATAVAGLTSTPGVASVELDGPVSIAQTKQTNATWGLDRIDQTGLPLDGGYTYTALGTGVTAYIVDTGILATHEEFADRIGAGETFIDDGRETADCNGHGTHVAGTVGGSEYGVAKGVTLVPVRVLDCNGSGTWSGVVAGLDWVATDASEKPAVANMSLGGGASSTVDAAVDNLITSGVTVAVAAGNGNRGGKAQDACDYSPARVPAAITVSATDKTDTKASWANYGSCVDLFAPGVSITSAWIYNETDSTRTISGTSMAAPHVAGVAALLLEARPDSTTTEIADSIVRQATPGVVSNAGTGSPNLLLYSLTDGASDSPDTGVDDETAPDAPTNLQATAGDVDNDGADDVTLTWTNVAAEDLDHYEVYRCAGSSCTPTTWLSDVAAGVTDYADVGLPDDTYSYGVKAVDTSGNASALSNVATAMVDTSSGGTSTALQVASETYSRFGGKNSDNHLDVSILITDGSNPVAGAEVTINLQRQSDSGWSSVTTSVGTTGSDGTVTFGYRGVGPGCYQADIQNVTKTGEYSYDGNEPTNTSC